MNWLRDSKMKNERIAKKITASLINESAVGMYFVLLMKGDDSSASALIGKMIPFDDARNKFESVAKNYINKGFSTAQKDAISKKSGQELMSIIKNSKETVGKFVEYAKKLVETADDPEGATFNGEDIEDIKDPKGGKINWKFHTGAGSVYIMSENGMSRRVKSEQGKGDTGLHDWQDLICFVKNDCSGSFDAGEVRSIEDALVHKRMNDPALKVFGDVSMVPKIGYNVFEIKKLGERHPTYHPGHEVARIDWKR